MYYLITHLFSFQYLGNAEYLISGWSVTSNFTRLNPILLSAIELTLKQEYWTEFCVYLVTVISLLKNRYSNEFLRLPCQFFLIPYWINKFMDEGHDVLVGLKEVSEMMVQVHRHCPSRIHQLLAAWVISKSFFFFSWYSTELFWSWFIQKETCVLNLDNLNELYFFSFWYAVLYGDMKDVLLNFLNFYSVYVVVRY